MRIVAAISFWYMLAACTYAAEMPTREAIIAYNDQCKAAGVQADFIAKFDSDFAGLDLSGVDFAGPHAVGLESNLQGANFRGADLRKANFGAAVLDRASFRDANLRDAGFVTASLQHVDLRGAQLAGASIRESNLAHANAPGVSFADVDITGSKFSFADLRGVQLAGATNHYAGADFRNANLVGADLSNLWLPGCRFQKADLRDAKFIGADVSFADFSDADLTGASISHAHVKLANFRTARGLDAAQRTALMGKSGLDDFERIQIATAFFESLWFPLALVVVGPALVWLYRRLTKKSAAPRVSDADDAVASTRFQFTLSNLLTATLLVAAFVGVAMWSATGFFSLAMVVAGYLMLDPVLYDAARRRSALRLLSAAGVYTAATMAMVPLGLATGFFELWLVFGIIVGPVAIMVVGTCWAAYDVKFSGLAATGLILWLIGLGFVNLYWLAESISLA